MCRRVTNEHTRAEAAVNHSLVKFDPTHCSSFHPSTLSIAVIAKENAVFGMASAFGGIVPLRPFFFYVKCGPARTSAEETIRSLMAF